MDAGRDNPLSQSNASADPESPDGPGGLAFVLTLIAMFGLLVAVVYLL